jgi:hypothetical protein
LGDVIGTAVALAGVCIAWFWPRWTISYLFSPTFLHLFSAAIVHFYCTMSGSLGMLIFCLNSLGIH